MVRRSFADGAGDGRETLPLDRVRGRLGLPRGVEGHGRADSRRQACGGAAAPIGARVSFIVPEQIEEYAEVHTTPPLALLAELAEETRATLAAPQMLTGTIEGRLLELLVYALRPRRGPGARTHRGYSSLSLAPRPPEDGPHH